MVVNLIFVVCFYRNLNKPKNKQSEDISNAANEVEPPLDRYEDLLAMLDPKGKGYVILDGVERDNPTISEVLRIETE